MKILIIQTAFPGDAILTLPMIQELKKKNENSFIDVLCIPSTKDIFESSPSINSVVVIDKKGEHSKFLPFVKFVKNLRANGYDKIYSPHRSFRSAFVVWMLGVAETYGFSNSSIPYIYKNIANYDPSSHEVSRNLSLIGFQHKEDNWKILPQISVAESSKEKVEEYKKENNLEKYIAIAPGSVWETKKYPVESFKHIIKFYSDNGFKVLLIGSKDDYNLCEDLNEVMNVINASGLFSFVETIELLKTTKLLICNDSAPTHLGICADIPVFTIYCSTVPEFGFYPYNSKSAYVSFDELKCKPCGIHGYSECPVGTFDCGKMLQPEEIIIKANTLLEKNGS
jgi:heptosyltransferase-2